MDDILKPESVSGEAGAPAMCPPATGPFFERADWCSFWLTAFLIFLVYLLTLSPSIDLSWSGILATGAMYGGVPHPPGFPLWTIYTHIFTLLPFSNIAWRISISSAVATTVSCGLIALMVSRGGALMLENLRGFQRLPAKSEKWIRIASGYAAGMSFGLSGSVWGHSVIVDWWPLTFAMFALVICLMLRWSYTPEKTRYLYAAIFLYGLTLTNSQSLIVALLGLELFIVFVNPALGRDLFVVSVLLLIHVCFAYRDSIAPSLLRIYIALASVTTAIAFAAAIKTRKIFTEWKIVVACFALLALGSALYFYCAIASMTNPPMNWSYPRTADGFFHLVERGQYERPVPVYEWNRYWQQICLYCGYVFHDYGWIYLIPAAVPFFMIHRMGPVEKRWMPGLLALFLCASFFLIALLNPSNDRASRDLHAIYLAPSFLILALWAGCGLTLIGTMLARPYERKAARFIPSGESPTNGEADEKAREQAWKQAKEISKKI